MMEAGGEQGGGRILIMKANTDETEAIAAPAGGLQVLASCCDTVKAFCESKKFCWLAISMLAVALVLFISAETEGKSNVASYNISNLVIEIAGKVLEAEDVAGTKELLDIGRRLATDRAAAEQERNEHQRENGELVSSTAALISNLNDFVSYFFTGNRRRMERWGNMTAEIRANRTAEINFTRNDQGDYETF
jgi:hypothetical protein